MFLYDIFQNKTAFWVQKTKNFELNITAVPISFDHSVSFKNYFAANLQLRYKNSVHTENEP